MRVLVTGSRGFIGTRVVPRLRRGGHEVTTFPGDLRDPGVYPPPAFDAVIHLASLITHRDTYTPEQFREVNIEGTRRLLATYSESHFVYVSTMDVERATRSVYAESKLETEREVARHARHCIVRLPSIFGPGQKQQSKLIPRLFRHYLLGEAKPELADDARPCLYVDDAAEAVCAGLNRKGVISVAGTVVHNRDLDRFVRMAVSDEKPEVIDPVQSRVFAGLVQYANELRQAGPTLNEGRKS